jgi:hypothetical protein
MIRIVLGFILILLFIIPVAGEVSLPPWNWSAYTGTSQWQVTVTEDDSGCGGGATSTQMSITIKHSGTTAVMGDVGHGPADGSFISGNILHIPGRTVADPPGTSTLSAYDVFFTTDCTIFAARYHWDYSGPDGSCSGSTALAGSNSKGCPAPAVVPVVPSVAPSSNAYLAGDLAAARSDLSKYLELQDLRAKQTAFILEFDRPGKMAGTQMIELEKGWVADETKQTAALEPKIEGGYAAILDKDPNNFWANWDLAELKKSQGKWNEYELYVEKALSNKDIALQTQEEVKKDIANRILHLPVFPTPDTSYLIQKLGPDARNAAQNVNGIDLLKGAPAPAVDKLRIWTIFRNPRELVELPATGGPAPGR